MAEFGAPHFTVLGGGWAVVGGCFVFFLRDVSIPFPYTPQESMPVEGRENGTKGEGTDTFV